MSDDDLIAPARKLEKNLLNFFARQGVSNDEGEDLVQETYLRLWKYRGKYKPNAKLSTFLFLIARQVRIDALRRQTRRTQREESWGADCQTTEVTPNMGVSEDVTWALSRLSLPLREVVELGVLCDMPYAEIAGLLKIPVGTVKSRMSNALKKLKEIFDDERS